MKIKYWHLSDNSLILKTERELSTLNRAKENEKEGENK